MDGGNMPGDRGVTLGLDLWELYRAGKQSLPAVATEYYDAGFRVGRAGSFAEEAFTRPAMFGGTQGPACGEWMELMSTIMKFLGDTGEALDDTGAALVMAANTYAETDRAAGRELQRLITDHHTE